MATQKEPLSVTHPELAKQSDGWDPSTVTAGSNRKRLWKCNFGHNWEATVATRSAGSGCPYCSGYKAIVGETDLATTNPELAAQADGWDPTTLTAGSGRKVGWKCQRGHLWQDSVSHRSSGRSCPICSNKRILDGYNDLATTNPELASQADGWDPTTVSAGSAKVVGWRCKSGHKWNATVSHRSSGTTCPVCSGHKVQAGVNDLATTNPELASQADGWDPTTVSAGSRAKVTWKCEKDHQWMTTVSNRSGGNGCPVCSGRTVLAGYNDLATTNPELAAQADGWDPTTLVAFSNKRVGWLCVNGHKWITAVSGRSGGSGCPICSGHKVLAGVNDLATTNPELASQADGWDPTTLKGLSNIKVGWRCESGHKWNAVVASRTAGNGCPICSGRTALSGVNDLATTNPELASQADGWDPTTLTSGSGVKVGWQCEQGHKWKSNVAKRSVGQGCPICANKQVLIGVNDLATTNPELAAQADGWDTTTVTAGSGKKVAWKCEKGHLWITAVNSRSKGTDCPICSGNQVLLGYNDLATTHPELAAQADGWDPTSVTFGSGKKKTWRCESGHKWITAVNARSGGSDCLVCSNKQVLVGYNDLATTNPKLAAQAYGWNPATLVAFSNKVVGWRCESGHKWKATVSHRSSGRGCPSCAQSGFDPNIDGWLYLIDHDALDMFQIGISNFPNQRLSNHSKRGWTAIEVRGPMEGHLAQQLETAILHAVERRGAVLGHKAEIEKFDGYSEAWTKDSLTVASFKQLLDWVYEDDNS
jgi:hypothetical protein